MSGGEKQRVYMAIVLACWPKVLVLDEPTSALDATHAGRLLQNLKQEADRRGATLLVVSHDGELVKNYADRVVRLEGGEKRE